MGIRRHFHAALAWLVLGAGLAFAAYALAVTPARLKKLAARKAVLSTLRIMEQQQRHDRLAVERYTALETREPPALPELAAQAAPGWRIEARLREPQAALEGWTVRTADVALGPVALTNLAAFLARAENTRPPWQLREINLMGLEQAGFARGALVLEALARP